MIDINEPKPIGDPDIITIDKNLIIEIQNYKKRGEKYCDVTLINSLTDDEKIIGRFMEPISRIKVLYNNGKLLIYNDKFNNDEKKDVITKVLALYNIIDDVVYSESQEEMLNIFDENINSSYLEDKNKQITKRYKPYETKL